MTDEDSWTCREDHLGQGLTPQVLDHVRNKIILTYQEYGKFSHREGV